MGSSVTVMHLRRIILDDEEPREPPQVGPAQPGADEHALGRVGSLVDWRAEVVEVVSLSPAS